MEFRTFTERKQPCWKIKHYKIGSKLDFSRGWGLRDRSLFMAGEGGAGEKVSRCRKYFEIKRVGKKKKDRFLTHENHTPVVRIQVLLDLHSTLILNWNLSTLDVLPFQDCSLYSPFEVCVSMIQEFHNLESCGQLFYGMLL